MKPAHGLPLGAECRDLSPADSARPWPAERQNVRTYERLLAQLGTLAEAVAQAAEPPTVYRALKEFVVAAAPCNGLYVSLFDAETMLRTCAYAWSEGREEDVSQLPPMGLTHSPASRALGSGQIVVTDDFQAAIRGQPRVDQGTDVDPRLPQSSLAVPMTVLGRAIGIFEIQSVEPAAYTHEHVAIMRLAASTAAIAIENFRLFQRERAQRLEAEAAGQTYRLLFRDHPHPVWVFDAETFRFLAVNRAAVRNYGYTEEEFLALTALDIRPPEDVAYFLDVMRDGGGHEARRAVHRKKNGELIHVEIASDQIEFRGRPARRAVVIDITRRVLAERARDAAEAETQRMAARLTNALETMTDAFVTFDAGWRFTYVNAEAERLLRRPRTTLLGRCARDEFQIAGTAFEREVERAQRDQRTIAFAAYASALGAWLDARIIPTPEGTAVYFRDVTAEREEQEKLRVSEARFKLLAKVAHDAIWDWDLATNQVWWNEGFDALFGRDATNDAHHIEGWVRRIHPADRERVVQGIHACIAANRDTWSAEYRFLRSDGGYAHVVDRGHVMRDGHERPLRMIGGVTDITARKQAEEKLREQAALLDCARDGIAVRDLADRVLYWNRGAERLYGWSADDVVGQPLTALLQLDAAQHARARETVLAAGEWNGELAATTRGEQSLTIDSRWTLLRDAHGAPKSILSIDTDVTDRRKLEAQFLRAQRLESIGTLAGGIAHDLNNLLAPIAMAVDLLREGEHAKDRLELIDIVQRSADRSASLVRQVLSFARGVEGARVDVLLRHVVKEIAAIVANTFPKNIAFETELADDLWLITGDPTQIQQVLLNLCVNARDAMPDGGALRIRAHNLLREGPALNGAPAAGGPHVSITVEDTGHGIPAAIIDKIFEPFFTTKETGRGSGLGLATTLGIVRSHKGTIEVASTPGRGSTFRVLLPARTEPPESGPSAQASALPRGHGERVLVVDDELPILSVTRHMLELFGYRVLTAENGAEALRVFEEQQGAIDAVITDLMMPVMDGPAAVARMRERAPTLRVIGASGLDPQGNARAAAAGISRFLAKPYSADVLLTTLHEVLES